MPVLPKSGATGFVRWLAPAPTWIPVYGWTYSIRNSRIDYRTSFSNNKPVGTNGIVEGFFTIQGAGTNYFDLFTEIVTDQIVDFDAFGWFDFVANKKRIISSTVCFTNEFRVDFNYSATTQPSFVWQASFTSLFQYNELKEENLSPMFTGVDYDHPLCVQKPCTLPITTTDTTYFPIGSPGQSLIQHVRHASIVQTFERPRYFTPLGICSSKGVSDIRVSMVVDGDFNYWIDQCGLGLSKKDYSFYYGSGINDAFFLHNGKVDSVDNLNVNVRTGELISATVNLSIANG